MRDDRLDGLGDEELMTVQGFDDFADYGALYQAPDGSLFQMQGFDESLDESLYDPDGFADELDEAPDMLPGEVRLGADGRLYQWVQGYDGLGDPVGFWSLIPALRRRCCRWWLPGWPPDCGGSWRRRFGLRPVRRRMPVRRPGWYSRRPRCRLRTRRFAGAGTTPAMT